jgi:hypothetical protein
LVDGQLFDGGATQVQLWWEWVWAGISRHLAIGTGRGGRFFGWGGFFGGFCRCCFSWCSCFFGWGGFFNWGGGRFSTTTSHSNEQKQRNQRKDR